MIDSILTARLEVLQRNLSRLADTSWLMQSMQLQYIKVPVWLWVGLETTIGKKVKNCYQPKLEEIDKLLVRAEGEKNPGTARSLIQEAWRLYTEVYQQSHEIFDECLTFIGGLTFRDQGLDERICPIADELIRDCSIQSIGGRWESLTVPALREARGKTLARIIRLRFQEWTIWTLPFTAHEFGHVVISESKELNEFVEDEINLLMGQQGALQNAPAARRLGSHFNEFLADAFATYTMGPAYACAAILLRFNPLIATDEDNEHPGLDHRSGHGSGQDPRKSGWKSIKNMIFKVFPSLRGLYCDAEGNLLAETMIMAKRPSDAKRAHVVLSILEQMNAKASLLIPPYKGLIERLRGKWEEELEQTGQSSALSAQDKQFLDDFAKRILQVFDKALIRTALYPPTATGGLLGEEGWTIAQNWSNSWRQQLDKEQSPLTIPSILPTHKFRDVFNAAWLCRISQPGKVNEIAQVAQKLCDEIIKERIKAEPAKKQFYQVTEPRKLS